MTTIACVFGYCLIILFNTAFLYEQNLFNLKYERGELVSFNRKYMGMAKVVNYKYNRTHAFTNLTFHSKHTLGKRMMLRVQAYKFMSNEYRFFPVTIEFNFCSYAGRNEFGLHKIFECGNFSCPMHAGWHHVCNFASDGSKFPPLIPEGQYKIEGTYLDGSIELMIINYYGTVSYPLIQ